MLMLLANAQSSYVAALSRQDHSAARDVVTSFCKQRDSLSVAEAKELSTILELPARWAPQFFVADVLANFRSFEPILLAPMLETAIAMSDPSANGRFVSPCVTAFGQTRVIQWLSSEFSAADVLRRMKISILVYHLRTMPLDANQFVSLRASGLPIKPEFIDSSQLKSEIARAAHNSDNLVELYHYKLALTDSPELFVDIPDHADALRRRISGHQEYEDLLYNQLGWQRPH